MKEIKKFKEFVKIDVSELWFNFGILVGIIITLIALSIV